MNNKELRPLLLLQMGDVMDGVRQRSGNFDEMFLTAAGLDPAVVAVVRVFDGETPDRPEDYCGVLVTGSLAMVTDREEWSEAAGEWLVQATLAGIPVLAVCYGHQLLAQALGGEVIYNPRGMEIGTLDIEMNKEGRSDPLTGSLPGRFKANLFHSQTVASLPPGAVVLASSEMDPHQMVRYRPNVYSIQFHPEFTGEILRAFMDSARAPASGLTEDTPEAAGLLRNFCRLVLAGTDHPFIRLASATENGELLEIWQRSVTQTHHFLTAEDIRKITPEVREGLAALPVWVAEVRSRPAGFMIFANDKVEALFIDPSSMGMGLGSAMLRHAWKIKKGGDVKVDVNEDNANALAFYLARGFRFASRSTTDASGRPFPILHLTIDAPPV